MTTESGSTSEMQSAQVTANEVAEAPVALWGDLPCPLRGPKFPFKRATRDVFQQYFKDHLNSNQEVFNSYFVGSDDERLRTEKIMRGSLPEVVARDAWGKALEHAEKNNYSPFILPAILCIVMPWLAASYGGWYNILVALAGIIGAIVLVYLLLFIILAPLEDGWMDSTAGFLTVTALFAGAVAWLYEQRPTGWLFLATVAAAVALCFAAQVVISIALDLAVAILNRITVVRHIHAELSVTFLEIISSLSRESPENANAAERAYYSADLIERHWRQLFATKTSHPAIQQRVRTTIHGISAGMREIGVNLTFPVRVTSSEESSESKTIQIMAKQLTAITTFRYGDLLVAAEPEIAIRPWLWRVLRGIRSVIAAVAPIILLLVIPRTFKVTINENLNGTLLTVSLGWLALYIIGWLDPKGLANVSKLSGITNAFSPQRNKD